MKKKKIILLGLIFVLFVLIGVLVAGLRAKNNKYLETEFISDWSFSDNIEDVFIKKSNISLLMKIITSSSRCVDGAGALYYFNSEQASDILNQKISWSSTAIAVVDIDSCLETYKFSIKDGDGWRTKTLSKNILDFGNNSIAFNQKKSNYFNDFSGYLKKLDIEVCSNYVPGMSGEAPGDSGLIACRENNIQNQENSKYLCEDESETLESGLEIYPVNNIYSCQEGGNTCNYSANILGELFTADDCGEERIKEIYGDSGNFHPFGLRIDLADNPARYDFLNTLERIGFKCSKINKSKLGPNEDSCSEFILDELVKIEDLLKLKKFFLNNYFSMNDVYLEHIDYTKNYLQVKSGQSLYVSDNLNLKFIYADPDPFFGDKCIITEKGNIIENSCGHLIEVIDKDPSISAYDAIANLIPDMNYCNIEINRDPITNFDSAYRIVPKEGVFSDNDFFSDIPVTCGKYVSFMSGYHDIYYNEDFPSRLLITSWGGHEPAGTLEKTDGPVSFWVHTVEFF